MTEFFDVYNTTASWQTPTLVPITAFGGVGDGRTDNTGAFVQALQAYNSIYIPEGNFLVNTTIILGFGQALIGGGQSSQITASSTNFDAIQVTQSYSKIENLRINGGNAGVRLYGLSSPCVQNSMTDVNIWGSNYGLVLDGYQNANNPCYWNNFYRVFIAQPAINGILLTKSGAGDTPNANTFHSCRVYSLGVNISGDGIDIQYANDRNSFIDCEANVSKTALSGFRLGANANDVRLINPYIDSQSGSAVTGVIIDSGSGSSSRHTIFSITATGGGAGIADNSGGNFIAWNSPGTSNSQQSYVQGFNIGYPLNLVANTLQSPFQIHGATASTANSSVFMYQNTTVGSRISMNKCRSVEVGFNGLCNNNDDIGYLDFNGNDNTHWVPTAQLRASVDAVTIFEGGIIPGRIGFWTQPPAGGGLLQGFWQDCNQNVIQGTAALATTATNGFMYIATCAGPPTGTPAPSQGAYTGRIAMIYDTTNHKLWVHDGSSWKGSVFS